mmetsp:Transcript_23776/g.51278  ORF Transcript_23776/g.51278 Transcript_23776/m.51278 type:complete len:279 (-) Transcript_23776:194-1030(-)|eukprot:CAMPEP_0183333206 /NCGR_PEP_ID=MMETSP0164_2-20130417/2160_1 /TAXON_ID=221442 /ORGANISM="Coccolithus pelagicus ssp braarudi, Strain PLY182g" /LENGTH=278 /DNA_ID=CAMNT_0025502083 /DNA_START=45 /DNA_END=881 /DNA_ORIENTATION=-
MASMRPAWVLASVALAVGQPNSQMAGGQPPPPLHETLLSIFDGDNDGGAALDEVIDALAGFEMMGGMRSPGEAPATENPMITMIAKAKRFAPTLHKLMDADGSGKLSREEFMWITATHGKITTPGVLKKLVEGIFTTIDMNADAILSAEELHAAIDGEALESILSMIQEQLPIPSLSTTGMSTSRGLLQQHFQEGMSYLDTNGDGAIERKEMLAAAKEFKKAFMSAVQTVETMGPMLTMFKGFQAQGAGRGGAGATRKRGSGPVKRTRPLGGPTRDEL